MGRHGLVLGLLGRHPVLRLRSAELRGAFGWSARSPPPRGAHALSVSRGEKKREREEEEEGMGKNDISPLISLRNEDFNRRSVRQHILQKTKCLSANLIIFSVRQQREVILSVLWTIFPLSY